MRDVLDWVHDHWAAGRRVGVGTVVATWRSAPRLPGASLSVDSEGEVVGSVSGGCVEGAVYDLAAAAVKGAGPELVRYGVSDDDAYAVGLTCGGTIEVFVEGVDHDSFPELGELAAAVAEHRPVALVTVVGAAPAPEDEGFDAGPVVGVHLLVHPDRTTGSLGTERLDAAAADDARGMLAAGATGVLHYGTDGQRREDSLRVLVQSFAREPRMLVYGAIDFAAAMARMGHLLGYRVTVCDARPVFATRARFPEAGEVVVRWPHQHLSELVADGEVDGRTVVCVLTHDPKFDVPLLEVALRSRAGYVGAMGSRATHDLRTAQLVEQGLGPGDLARLSSPIGLDLGARTPEETAVSIAAEIIARRWAGTGRPLAETSGRIHHDVPGGMPGHALSG